MRLGFAIGLAVGVALSASIALLALWPPLYFVSGVLVAAGGPRIRRRQWVAKATPVAAHYTKDGFKTDHHTGVAVECRGPGDPVRVALLDPRRDDFDQRVAESLAIARDKATILNVTGVHK